MRALRSPLILAAPLVGLTLAALLWMLLGGRAAVIGPIDALQSRLDADRPAAAAPAAATSDAAARAAASPIFALTTGPGAVADVAVRLDGIAVSPRGSAALISIDGKPADWLALGATRDGVTLMEVNPTKVMLDTAIGFKELAVGQQSKPATAPSGAAQASTTTIPPGARLPPPPASAPATSAP